MGRKTITEEEKARKALFKEFLSEHPIRNGQDLNALVREFLSDMEGKKDILGLWIGENESSKFWLGVRPKESRDRRHPNCLYRRPGWFS